jgi:hypothetical protein
LGNGCCFACGGESPADANAQAAFALYIAHPHNLAAWNMETIDIDASVPSRAIFRPM